MAKEVDRLISEAAAVLTEAMDDAAAIALVAVEKYGVVLQTFCKQVTQEAGMPEAWDALRRRTYRLQEARSEGVEARAPRNRDLEAVRRAVRDQATTSALPHGDKVKLARQLLSDESVAQEAMTEPKTWSTVMKSASSVGSTGAATSGGSRTERRDAGRELNREWADWLNQLNTILMRGTALAERTEREDATLDAYGESGLLIYHRITERKLDAEIKQLFETHDRGGAR